MTTGCARTIGDSCTTNVQCSPLGDRFCDLAAPDGYCTVEGCDSTSCPDSAVCVRFFSPKIGNGTTCDVRLTPALTIDRSDPKSALDCANPASCCRAGSAGCCNIGERCVCEQSDCGTGGYCASESSERRWCMHTCHNDGDCRSGYQCFTTGSNGSLAVTVINPDGTTSVPTVGYCASPQ